MPSYQIQRGDTLDKIARQNNTSVRTLTRMNGLSDPHAIYAGDTLKLPADKMDLSAAARQDLRYNTTDHPRRASQADVDELAGLLDKQQLQPRSAYLKEMVPAALAIQAKYGLPAKVILAQAALESNWGHSAIGKYNVFGIKGTGSQGSLPVTTHEVVHGRHIKTTANFAHYGSYDEAFEAYARTLHNGNFSRALRVKSDPVRYARALQGVYATDPHYAAKLLGVMRREKML